MKKIDKSNCDEMGGLPIIEIISRMGLEFDYHAASIIKYFMRAPYFGQEEMDYRAAMYHLEIIYSRVGFGPALHRNKVNLGWIEEVDPITASKIIKSWELEGLRAKFIESFHFSASKISTALRILDKIIDNCSDYSDIINN